MIKNKNENSSALNLKESSQATTNDSQENTSTSLPKSWKSAINSNNNINPAKTQSERQASSHAAANDSAQIPRLKPVRVIGNGAFGKYTTQTLTEIESANTFLNLYVGFVFEAFDLNRNMKVAVKRTQKAGNIVSREYEVMSLLKGDPNVVQLVEFFYSLDQKQRLIQNIVMEYCESSLEDQLRVAEKLK